MTEEISLSDAVLPALTAENIAEYLKLHPQFFEKNSHLLAEIYLPSPHGRGAISLAERQQLAQRDKIRVLEAKLAGLIENSQANTVIDSQVHQLTLGLLASENLEVLTQMIAHQLEQVFKVPHHALYLWVAPRNPLQISLPAFASVDESVKEWGLHLTAPYCGKPPLNAIHSLFTGAAITSVAALPLRSESVFGLLLLASDDENRFHADMGTAYLQRIGELISASLLPHIQES